MNAKELLERAALLQHRIVQGEKAAAELEVLRPRLSKILDPHAGGIIELLVKEIGCYEWHSFEVYADGQLWLYEPPKRLDLDDLFAEPEPAEAVPA